MATDQTYTQIRQAFQAAAGLASMEATDEFFFLHSLNRAAHRAWSESEIWPRYLVLVEERSQTDNVIPTTETGLDTIGEFLRIYTANPYTRNSSARELDFTSDSNGATIINPPSDVSDTVYVTYKKIWDGPYTESSTTIPEEFADYIIQSVLADFYTGDGQWDKAQMAEARADRYLTAQLSRLSYNNRNPYAWGMFSTHTRNQSR